jgi:hypothetical protein
MPGRQARENGAQSNATKNGVFQNLWSPQKRPLESVKRTNLSPAFDEKSGLNAKNNAKFQGSCQKCSKLKVLCRQASVWVTVASGRQGGGNSGKAGQR